MGEREREREGESERKGEREGGRKRERDHLSLFLFQDWREVWLRECFWHVLFAFILLIVMIIWRPSANRNRYSLIIHLLQVYTEGNN